MPMATEQEYDDIIAPILLEAAKKAEALGMSLIARVEWEPGESGITQVGPMDSIGQRITRFAAHCHGNIDAMLLGILRSGVDCSASMFLHRYTKEGSDNG
jgi:hypothetical protein